MNKVKTIKINDYNHLLDEENVPTEIVDQVRK